MAKVPRHRIFVVSEEGKNYKPEFTLQRIGQLILRTERSGYLSKADREDICLILAYLPDIKIEKFNKKSGRKPGFSWMQGAAIIELKTEFPDCKIDDIVEAAYPNIKRFWPTIKRHRQLIIQNNRRNIQPDIMGITRGRLTLKKRNNY